MEGPYDLADMKALLKNDIEFVIHSSRQLNFLKQIKKFKESHPIWLKFDSGMNRLGFSIEDSSIIFEEVSKKTNQIVLMSHFYSFKGNAIQLKKFKDLEKRCSSDEISVKKSLCNSGGMINYPASQKDIVRPGISMFGSRSNLKDKNIKLESVMTLKSKFISLKEIEKGEKVGYEGTWQAKKRTKIGILPVALRNYLLRLGWSYKDKEIFTKQESIDLFDLSGVGKSPSKLDMNRIYSINETYIKSIDQKDLFNFFKEYVSKYKKPLNQSKENVLLKSMGFLKNKAKTLEDIWNNAQYIINDKIEIGADDKKLIDDLSKKVISDFTSEYEKLSSLSRETLEPLIKSLIDKHKTNFKGVGQPLRIALVGSRFGPGLYDVILSLDKSEVIKRLKQI